jgi:transcriptional regulator with XRE-family HTH domain
MIIAPNIRNGRYRCPAKCRAVEEFPVVRMQRRFDNVGKEPGTRTYAHSQQQMTGLETFSDRCLPDKIGNGTSDSARNSVFFRVRHAFTISYLHTKSNYIFMANPEALMPEIVGQYLILRRGETVATVGDRIRMIREELKMTQDKLAEQAGLSKGFLSEVENNKRNISSDNLLRLANVLGASIDFLLRGDERDTSRKTPITIPPELSQAAQELNLSYSATVELLEAHDSIFARRSDKQIRRLDVEDWKRLYHTVKGVFG